MKTKLKGLLENKKSAHLLYSYNNKQNYIQNAAAYILDGIEAGEVILLIENERTLPHLIKELKKHLNSEQMQQIHQINNFDFYFSSGSYHPPAIFEYIERTNKPFLDNNIKFRTWTHVEWSTIEGPLNIVKEFEKEVDKLVFENGLIVLCAYDTKGMPDSFKEALLQTHPYIMTDDEILYSDQYNKIEQIKEENITR